MATMEERMRSIQNAAQGAVDNIEWVIRNSSGVLAQVERVSLGHALTLIRDAMRGNEETSVETCEAQPLSQAEMIREVADRR